MTEQLAAWKAEDLKGWRTWSILPLNKDIVCALRWSNNDCLNHTYQIERRGPTIEAAVTAVLEAFRQAG